MGVVKVEEHVVDSATVVFTPSGLRGRFKHGTTVLQAAQSLGVDLESACGGRGLCGRCQVLPSFGDFAKHQIQALPTNISEVTDGEVKSARVLALKADRRLGCSAKILGDMVIDVPADSQLHQQKISKEAQALDLTPDPVVRIYVITVEEPDMHKPASDFNRIKQALKEEHNVDVSECDLTLLQSLQPILRKAEWTVTVAVYDDYLLQAVWPGFKESVYGLVVDLGSTTIAAHLLMLSTGEVVATSASMNPQIRFGEDLMSRVSYVMMNPGGDTQMCEAVRNACNELAGQACLQANIDITDILEMVVVGNPVMHHLFLGIDPTPLGSAPFALAIESALTMKSWELDIKLNPQARVYLLPCIAGHIGADTTAMILAQKPWLSEEMSLLVDVGTNAEIVLGNSEKILASSSPTGPAFEGAQISCGQRAAIGAIERVRIDPQTLEPRFKVIGSDLWSNEDGFTEAAKVTGVSGVCGSGIIEVVAEMYLCGIISYEGVINTALAETSERVVMDGRTASYILHEGDSTLKITQNDVRAIQLAKAALYAGIKLLLDKAGIEKPDRIGIAGAFGSHIDVKYAMVLGLIPDCELSRVTSIGNAAGTGARIALMDKVQRATLRAVLSRVEKIETAVEEKFQEHFVNAMALPHKFDGFTYLSAEVTLPKRIEASEAAPRAGARARRKRR